MSEALRMPARSGLALLLSLGCAHTGKTAASGAPEAGPAADITGVWDWIVSSSDDDNNKRVEQEEWHLLQASGSVHGYYLRTVTVVSGDDTLFRCNRQKRFQKRMRFDVSGRVMGTEVVLQETGVDIEPGPCSAPLRGLQSYRGRATAQSLTLMWDSEAQSGARLRGQQVLFRRPPDEGSGREEHATVATQPFEHAAEPPAAQISGTWIWEMRGVGWDGDAKVEQEEWHLSQTGNLVRGYYDRIVTSISSDGHPYRCNQQTQFATVTRYQIEGSISGRDIQIREVSFDAKPSACEDRPQRRLDVYHGEVASEEIRLSWGTGQQVLRRSRPQVPTSSF
jgi:hypothetical protein